ncbi:alanine racemase [Ignavibacteria bacterium]
MRATRVEISVKNLIHNIEVIRQTSAGCAIMAMIKANGYGHGIVETAKILRRENIEFLGVAFTDEAVALRNAGDEGAIAVLTPPEPDDAPLFAKYNLRPVISTLDEAMRLSTAASDAGVEIYAHLYIDTGLSRDGVLPDDIPCLWEKISKLGGIVWEGCCTHFATADDTNLEFAREQLAKFNGSLAFLAKNGANFRYIHAANTGALTQFPEARFNLVRPGYSLYGLSPASHLDAQLPVKPLLTWKTKILSLRRIPAGTSVSYGRRYISECETVIATIPVGYGDGYMRNLSGKQEVLIGGRRFPTAGVVCMGECMVDVGDYPVNLGDEVVLIGSQGNETITVAELAANCNTIGYEIITAISARVPRIYVIEN